MAKVMIRCPATGRQVFTGIEIHPSSIAMLPPINTFLVCSMCGDTHVWSMLDVQLDCEPVERPKPPAPELQRLPRRLRQTTQPQDGPKPTRRILPRAS
jgi:hypothetical protein